MHLIIQILQLLCVIKYNKMQQSSISPSKKQSQSIRVKNSTSKPKEPHNEQEVKTLPGIKQYVRQFPLDIPQQVIVLLNNFTPTHSAFDEQLSKLKLYKAGLASQIQSCWIQFMEFMRLVVVKMHRKAQKNVLQREQKISELLNMNSKYQNQKQSLKQRIETLEHLRELQSNELEMANQQLQLVSKQMTDIYSTLHNDMGNVLNYLAQLEKSRAKNEEIGSNQIYHSLQGLSTILNNFEREQKDTGRMLFNMREVIKQMARCTKVSTGTQVDESELQTKTGDIFKSNQEKLEFQIQEAANANLPKEQQEHLLDKMRSKERDTTHEAYKPKQNIDKPWALTPTLLVFLENMSKENQAGRVLPYSFVKQLIEQIYNQRIAMQQQIVQGQMGNAMLFDQFVVHFFLKKHRIRRLAEVKLLQFIISLKYYAKFWVKVQTFCYLMDVMKYQPTFDINDSGNFKFDIYTQNFFFQVFKVFSNFEMINQEDGSIFIPLRKVKKIMRVLLFFTDQMSRSRLSVKLQKEIRVYDKVDYVEYDIAVILFIDEYFSVRKKNASNISKNFSRMFEQVQGFLSLDEMLEIFTDMQQIYRAGSDFPYKYPVDYPLQVSKLYLYAITSFKNGYQLNGNSFVQACQRYGFDSPFPFIHACYKKKGTSLQQKQSLTEKQIVSPLKSVRDRQTQPTSNKKDRKLDQNQPQIVDPLNINSQTPVNTQRIDIASKIFSQHFSLLRQMKQYCDIFKATLSKENDPEILWKSFNQIYLVLEKGCQFLKYPLLVKQGDEKAQYQKKIKRQVKKQAQKGVQHINI